jgi:prolyl oligopeptidase
MKKDLKLLLVSLLLCTVSAMAQSSEDERFEALMAREWKSLNQRQPVLAIYLGEPTDLLWPDNTRPAREKVDLHYQEVMAELDGFAPETLTGSNATNLRLFRQQLEWQRKQHQHQLDLFSMNQREGLHTTATLSSSIPFDSMDDFETWVARLEAFDDYTNREILVLEEAIEQQRVQPRIIAQRMLETVQVQPELHKKAKQSPFYAPFLEASPELISDPRFEPLTERATAAITEKVAPAFERLTAFLEGPYLEAAPELIGLGRLPGGEEAYAFLIKRYTTTELSADEVHEIGLQEVARIRGEMEKIKEQVGFDGTLEEFFQHLRTSPDHYVDDPEILLQRYRSFCKQVDGQMPKVFKTLPRKPYGVRPIPDYIAPATTTAYYLPGAGHLAGTYYVNLYKPETRALFEIPALSLHESVPGHHHQIALAQELPLPPFRRESAGFGDYTVFVEGWALYSESLGEEMGLYSDPYDLFGRYTYEMWRAIRLVLDTGIHAKGWSRTQAIEYFLNNSPRSELDVTNEVDRYISWPGQALAYKMGELEIWEQRRRAKEALGERFDLREFHDAVLSGGAVPMDELEMQITEYINRSRL